MKFDENFVPKPEHIFFKEILHERLSDEEILELRLAPAMYLERLVPFSIEAITSYVLDDTTFMWLYIKDPALLMFEAERPALYAKLHELAMTESLDTKGAAIQLKAIEALLKQLEKASATKKQNQSKLLDENEAAKKLMRVLPKQFAKLSEFELAVTSKQVKQLCQDFER